MTDPNRIELSSASWHRSTMRGSSFVIAISALLPACQQSAQTSGSERELANVHASRIPVSTAAISDTIWHLKVFRNGQLRWNGVAIDEATLQKYLKQFGDLPRAAGYLSIEIEPGTPTPLAASVRSGVIDSGLCEQKRCIEERWNIKTHVVYQP